MKRSLDLKSYFELNRGKVINMANKYWLDIKERQDCLTLTLFLFSYYPV